MIVPHRDVESPRKPRQVHDGPGRRTVGPLDETAGSVAQLQARRGGTEEVATKLQGAPCGIDLGNRINGDGDQGSFTSPTDALSPSIDRLTRKVPDLCAERSNTTGSIRPASTSLAATSRPDWV